MKLIIGLGNPGSSYAATRHNVGFRVINFLAKKLAIPLDSRRCRSRLGEGEVEGEKIVLARPGTYMNLSGKAVACLMNRYQAFRSDLLVVMDDTDLDVGCLRLRRGGSSGGHRGLSSVIEHIGGSDFPRLRVGVGKCPPQLEMVDYVLSEFTLEEVEIIQKSIERAASAVMTFVTEGIEKAMNRYN